VVQFLVRLRITTGSFQNWNAGTLDVGVDDGSGYAWVTTGQIWAVGSTVLDASYEMLSGVKVRNPTNDGWEGAIEYSSDGGVSYVPFVCTDCTKGSSTARIFVDGNFNPGGFETSACANGATCSLQVPPPPESRFAVITATQNAETLPYGPGPIGTKPAFFCTDCIGSPSDSWTETVACDGSNVDMTIVYQFGSAMSVVDRMRQCSATGCNVGFTVYGPGITTTSFHSDWWFTDKTVFTSGSRVSSDDGMWGGAPGEVNGDGQCYGNTGKTGFYGFGNCNAGDSQGITVYYGPNGSKQCPSLKAQLYATPI